MRKKFAFSEENRIFARLFEKRARKPKNNIASVCVWRIVR